MKNTLSEKKKFFGQYIGQYVLSHPEYVSENPNTNVADYFNGLHLIDDGYFLQLTPLHLISDEDAIEIFNHVYPNHLPMDDDEKIESIKEVFEDFRGYRFLDLKTSTRFIDKVREISYAIDFNGLSVEEQVSRGWAVLKTKI